MNISTLLYYILKLITEGHKWQYQNATCTNKPPKFYFSVLQWIAILLAFIFTLTNNAGLSNDIIDTLLNSLSIMTGLFLALIVVVYDKFKELRFDASSDSGKINRLKSWNYLQQFNALASYAIFISLIVISILVGTLLYGQQIDFSNVSIATSIEEVNVSLSIKMMLVCVVRFCVVYFLLDFFILTIYAVTSLFQLINLEMLSKQPTYNIRGNKVMEDKLVLKKEYPILSIISKIAIGISVVGIIAYEWENIVSAFQRLF